MNPVDWGVFKEAWREFRKDWSAWALATFLTIVSITVPYLIIVVLLVRVQDWESNRTWLQEFQRILILRTVFDLGFYWLTCTAVVSIWPDQRIRSPLKEAIRLTPQFLIVQAVLSAITIFVSQSLESTDSWIILNALYFIFILYLPLTAHEKISPLKAILIAPVVLFKHPGHAVIIFLAMVLSFSGFFAFGIGILVTMPISIIITLLTLDQIRTRAVVPQTENSASNGV